MKHTFQLIIESTFTLLRKQVPYLASFFLCLFTLRIVEFYTVNFVGEEAQQLSFLFLGTLFDLRIVMLVSLLALLLDGMLLFVRKQSLLFLHLFVFVFLVLNFCLVVFFQRANIPLDESVYLFTWEELNKIANLEKNFSIAPVLYFLLVYTLYILPPFLLKKRKAKQTLPVIFVFIPALVNAFFVNSLYYQNGQLTKEVFTNNRLVFFAGRSKVFFDSKESASLFRKNYTSEDFRDLDPSFFRALNKKAEFPLAHSLNKPSKLAPFFKESTKTPNIVFIIVESLSSDFIGKYASTTGDCMPFLDSLSKQSLYFPNFLSTCQRTFNVLPASLSSLPNSTDGNFTTNTEFVPQLSLPQLLSKTYESRFYCGVDLNYSHMGDYLSNSGVKQMVSNWDKKYDKKFSQRPNYWGYPDGALYNKSWEDFEEGNLKEKARLDIFLTISSHDPYAFPDDEKYAEKIRKKSKGSIPKEIQDQLFKDEFIMASYMYTDDMLRSYFKQAKKKSDFDNTIFVIYGDHGCPFYARTQLSKFQVPLLIYSPLLKKSKKIEAVSSQIDLTPTLLSLLHDKYQLKLPKKVYFTGRDLDTNSAFGCQRTLPFLSYNGANESMIKNRYALLKGDLFELDNDLSLKRIANKKWRKKLEKQLNYYENFSRYCFQKKKIVPLKTFLANNGNPHFVNSNKFKLYFSALKNLAGKMVNQEKIKLCDDFNIKNTKTQKVKVESEIEWFLDEETDLDSIGRVVLSIHDTQNGKEEKVSWEIVRPRYKGRFVPHSFNKLKVMIEIDLKKLPKLSAKNQLRFYIFNKKRRTEKIRRIKNLIYTD